MSRLANGKYLQTEFGIFELRYFFTNSISGAGSKGSRFSKTAVKEMVREILTGPTDGAVGKPRAAGKKPPSAGKKSLSASKKPLSDSRIAAILAEKGVKIARRTVAKYRQELDIDSSYRRT